MSQSGMENLGNSGRQLALFLPGQENVIFTHPELNLPYRFFAYARPEVLDPMFKNLFSDLSQSRTTINRQDAWGFNDVMSIIAPKYAEYTNADAMRLVIEYYKIPETHLYIRQDEPHGRIMFPTDKLYLSRYAMCLIAQKELGQSHTFKQDLNRNLFIRPDEVTDTHSAEFKHEMKTAFAMYFFGTPDARSPRDVSGAVWSWIRGRRLKMAYEPVMKKLRFVVSGFLGNRFSDTKFNKFKLNNIFDILFCKPGDERFLTQYNKMLQSIGYERSDKNGDFQWVNIHTNDAAPEFPDAFFQPHVEFLLTWAVDKFCEYLNSHQHHCKTSRRGTWLENTATEFFTSVRDGMTFSLGSEQNKDFKTHDAPLFYREHHKEARKRVDKMHRGEKKSETLGILDKLKPRHLFNDDTMGCLNIRHRAERNLEILHTKFLNEPTHEIAEKIEQCELEISTENRTIYGFDLQAFVQPNEVLNVDGSFTPRQMFGNPRSIYNVLMPSKKKAVIEKNNPTDKYNILREIIIGEEFTILPNLELTIPRGIIVSADPKSGKRYLDQNGIFESVNPMTLTPTKFKTNSDGSFRLNQFGQKIPSFANENFEYANILFESDKMPTDMQIKQAKMLVAQNVIRRVTLSGSLGKTKPESVHMICTLDENGDIPKNSDEYTWLAMHIVEKYNILDADVSCFNNGRFTRLPGAIRPDTGKKQTLLHSTNVKLYLEWRPDYEKYLIKKKAEQERGIKFFNKLRTSFTMMQAYREWALNNVRAFWTDGNRHNMMLNRINYSTHNNKNYKCRGIINDLLIAGLSADEIYNMLSEEKNRDLNRSIRHFINKSYFSNMR